MSVYISYQFNKEYIATELCENKDRPELACNGQCILMKKLQAVQQKQSSEKKQNFIISTLTFEYLLFNDVIEVTGLGLSKAKFRPTKALNYFFEYQSIIPHPPQFFIS